MLKLKMMLCVINAAGRRQFAHQSSLSVSA